MTRIFIRLVDIQPNNEKSVYDVFADGGMIDEVMVYVLPRVGDIIALPGHETEDDGGRVGPYLYRISGPAIFRFDEPGPGAYGDYDIFVPCVPFVGDAAAKGELQ